MCSFLYSNTVWIVMQETMNSNLHNKDLILQYLGRQTMWQWTSRSATGGNNLIIENLVGSFLCFSPTVFKVNCQKFRPIYRQGTGEGTGGETPRGNSILLRWLCIQAIFSITHWFFSGDYRQAASKSCSNFLHKLLLLPSSHWHHRKLKDQCDTFTGELSVSKR